MDIIDELEQVKNGLTKIEGYSKDNASCFLTYYREVCDIFQEYKNDKWGDRTNIAYGLYDDIKGNIPSIKKKTRASDSEYRSALKHLKIIINQIINNIKLHN